jgi:hypothetical protein
VKTKVGREAGLDEVAGRTRDEHLAAVRRSADTRSLMHGQTAIAPVGDRSLAGVDADPHTDDAVLRPTMLRQHAKRSHGSSHRPARGPEGDEEAITLAIDLDPVVLSERVAKQAAVSIEHVPVRGRAERLHEPSRPLDVGEEEGDGAGREIHRPRETVKQPHTHAATDADGQTLGMSLG